MKLKLERTLGRDTQIAKSQFGLDKVEVIAEAIAGGGSQKDRMDLFIVLRFKRGIGFCGTDDMHPGWADRHAEPELRQRRFPCGYGSCRGFRWSHRVVLPMPSLHCRYPHRPKATAMENLESFWFSCVAVCIMIELLLVWRIDVVYWIQGARHV